MNLTNKELKEGYLYYFKYVGSLSKPEYIALVTDQNKDSTSAHAIILINTSWQSYGSFVPVDYTNDLGKTGSGRICRLAKPEEIEKFKSYYPGYSHRILNEENDIPQHLTFEIL